MNKDSTFEAIDENVLEDIRGGMLLPAIQAAREAASSDSTHSGGVNVLMGDGSVKF